MREPYYYFVPNNNYYNYYHPNYKKPDELSFNRHNNNSFFIDKDINKQLLRPCIISENYCDYFDLGDKAPNFTLQGIVNDQPKDVSLSDYLGKWVVLFFYGADFTFAWPTELAAVADRIVQFKALNTEVLAISTDSIYSHKIFKQTSPSGQKINYPLLSDKTQRVSKIYGVLNEDGGFAYRSTFIIDPYGKIQAWLTNPQPVGRNIDEILRIIAALQYNKETGLGVQAGWQPGDRGIETGWDFVGKY